MHVHCHHFYPLEIPYDACVTAASCSAEGMGLGCMSVLYAQHAGDGVVTGWNNVYAEQQTGKRSKRHVMVHALMQVGVVNVRWGMRGESNDVVLLEDDAHGK